MGGCPGANTRVGGPPFSYHQRKESHESQQTLTMLAGATAAPLIALAVAADKRQ
jgi:hypothetical protein